MNRQVAKLAGVAACVAGLLLASACSSGSSSNSGSVDSAAAEAEASAAADAIKSAEEAPTEITVTTPLPKAPTDGKLVWLNCNFPTCAVIGEGAKAAAEAAGWEYEQIQYDATDPATLTAAFKRALTLEPTAVSMSGIPPEAGWSSVFADYEAAGVAIIASFLGGKDVEEPIFASVSSGETTYVNYGEIVARWFIADSKGQGQALVQTVEGYPVLKAGTDAIAATIKAECSACKVTKLENTIAQAGSNGIVPAVIPALQKDPNIKYALMSNLEFSDALPPALAAANLDVKIAGWVPTATGYGLMQQGKFAAAVTHASRYSGWLIVDSALRFQQGLELDPGDTGPMPTQLLLPDTEFELKDSYEPAGYEDQFKSLWQVN